MKKIYAFTKLLFSVLIIFANCNSQGNISKSQRLLKQETDSNEKAELVSKAMVIFHDTNDNYWLVDDTKGVYKYDGQKLKLFTSNDGLNNYKILSVQEDDFGNIYFDTPQAVYKYDGQKFVALPVIETTESVIKWKLEPGDLLFRMGWDNGGPYRFDGKNLYHLKFPKNKMEDDFYRINPNASFNPYAIYSIYKDSKGNYWFGTSNVGVYLFDGEEISWMYEHHHIETPEGGNFGVRSFGEDQDGNIWICNTNYKFTILPNKKESDKLNRINYKRQVGLENVQKESLYFYSMELDNNGNLMMFAKEDGLWLNDGKNLTQFFVKVGGKNISPTSMYKDKHGTFWFSTDKYGIYKYDGNTFDQFIIK